jgi:hypothetical protein
VLVRRQAPGWPGWVGWSGWVASGSVCQFALAPGGDLRGGSAAEWQVSGNGTRFVWYARWMRGPGVVRGAGKAGRLFGVSRPLCFHTSLIAYGFGVLGWVDGKWLMG